MGAAYLQKGRQNRQGDRSENAKSNRGGHWPDDDAGVNHMLHRNLARRSGRPARCDIDRVAGSALHRWSCPVPVVSTTISASTDLDHDLVAALAAALDRIERAADARAAAATLASAEARAADAREMARLRRIETAAAAALAELDAILDSKAA